MRLLNCGFETQSYTDRGWTYSGIGGTSFVGSGSQRLTPNNNGGNYALSLGSGGGAALESPDFPLPAVESFHRVGVYRVASGSLEYRLRNGGATIAVVQVDSSGNVNLFVDGLAVASSAGTLATATWYTLSIRYLMRSTGGVFQVFVDDDQTTPFVSYTGDTDPNTDVDIEAVQLYGSNGSRFDDIAVQAVSMRYDGGSGSVPVVGETLTGGTSSATAVVTAVESGSDGVSGRVLVRSVSGTFQDNETLTGSTAAVAVNNAPAATTSNPSSVSGLDTNSGHLTPFGYIVLLVPDGNGSFSECSPSTAGDNYTMVDDWSSGASGSDFVESSTDGARDFYTLDDLGSAFSGVESVEVIAMAERQGTAITNIELGIRPDSTNYFGDVQSLGTSGFAPFSQIWDVNPEDGENWTPSDVDGLEAGFRFTA